MTLIRELYEMELAERRIDPNHVPNPLVRITEKPKKGDVTVTYQGDIDGPRYKQLDWEDESEFEEFQ